MSEEAAIARAHSPATVESLTHDLRTPPGWSNRGRWLQAWRG
jgi:hypothetical protein